FADRRVTVAAVPSRELRVVGVHQRDPIGEAVRCELGEERLHAPGLIEAIARREEVADVETDAQMGIAGFLEQCRRLPPRVGQEDLGAVGPAAPALLDDTAGGFGPTAHMCAEPHAT
ncbi:MAG: hypothetical protein M3Q20_06735, partial [Actinomycetota bacterium]|nr:hypothetical protein [Actinomycetota bacterium]